ncbi:hypothetical protein ACFLU5_16170 [Bacteroidota bacterium]
MSSVFRIPPSAFDRYTSPLYFVFVIFSIHLIDLAFFRKKNPYVKYVYIFLIVWSSVTAVRAYKNCYFWYENRCNGEMEVFEDAY